MSDWNHNGEHDSFDSYMDYEMKYGKNGGSSGGGGGGSCLAMSLYLVGGFVLFALFLSGIDVDVNSMPSGVLLILLIICSIVAGAIMSKWGIK